MTHNPWLIGSAALSLALGACGSGGGGVNSTPPPPPSPTPTPTPTPSPASVTIFKNPVPGEFVTVGASLGRPGVTYPSPSSRFGALSTSSADQPHIRYTLGGYYEIEMPGKAWDRLIPDKGIVDPNGSEVNLQPAGSAQNDASLYILRSLDSGYLYSEMAAWNSNSSSRSGWFAFGDATPQGAVPITGSAAYQGTVHGTTDIMQHDYLAAGYVPTSVDGSVTLNFDFGQGALSGAMALFLPDGMQPLALGTYAFKDTAFSVGSTTYSGRFATSVSGDNFFLGQFTGPNAQETIGAWALPFVFSTSGQTIQADGKAHQAFGAWVAKKGP